MSVNDEVRKAIEARDIKIIRDRLWARIIIDPTLSEEFKETLDFCLKNGISEDELYEKHDGRDVNLKISEENRSELAGALRTNFSKERLEAVRKMGCMLYSQHNENPSLQRNDKVKNSGTTRQHSRPKTEKISSSQTDCQRKISRSNQYSIPKDRGENFSQEDGGTRKIFWRIAIAGGAIIAGAILFKKFF